MLKKISSIMLFVILICACKVSEDNINYLEGMMNVKTTESVLDYRYKNNTLICVIDSEDGYIHFKNDEIFYFNSIKNKTSKFFLDLEIILIPEKPFLIITYDDAPASDYDIYQIHKSYIPIIPAEVGIILSGFGLGYDKLIEMCYEGGWEVVHHSYSHTRFERLRLQQLLKKGNNKVYGWFVHTFIDNNEILLDDDLYKIICHGEDEYGKYFVVQPSFTKDYSKLSFVQLSDAQIRKELSENLLKFENETNLKIKHFTWPYTVSDLRTQEYVSEIFYSARGYNGLNSDGTNNLIDGGLNFYPFNNRYTLNSANYVQYYSNDEIFTMLTKCKQENAVMIQFAHSWDSNFSSEKLVFLIDNALKLGIDIVTRSNLFEYYELDGKK